MKKIYKIKKEYEDAACDIFQIHKMSSSTLNEKQIARLINLNVLNKWAYKTIDHGFKNNDYVICLEEPAWELENDEGDGGAGWQAGLVFQIDHIDNRSCIIWGGKDGCGVYANYLRKATQEEITQARENGTLIEN